MPIDISPFSSGLPAVRRSNAVTQGGSPDAGIAPQAARPTASVPAGNGLGVDLGQTLIVLQSFSSDGTSRPGPATAHNAVGPSRPTLVIDG